MRTRKQVHDYWMNPDSENAPQHYLKKKSSPFLVGIIKEIADSDASILEVGCNVGRNLNHLWQAGYRNISGVEINKNAVEMMTKKFPTMKASIHTGAIEDLIGTLPNFDVIFSMAVFCHIHPDSNFIFEGLAKLSKRYIITIEDERHDTNRHFARKYNEVFNPFGFVEIGYHEEVEGMNKNYHARIMERK